MKKYIEKLQGKINLEKEKNQKRFNKYMFLRIICGTIITLSIFPLLNYSMIFGILFIAPILNDFIISSFIEDIKVETQQLDKTLCLLETKKDIEIKYANAKHNSKIIELQNLKKELLNCYYEQINKTNIENDKLEFKIR